MVGRRVALSTTRCWVCACIRCQRAPTFFQYKNGSGSGLLIKKGHYLSKKLSACFRFVSSPSSHHLCARQQRHNVVDYINVYPRPKKQRNILHHLGEAYGTPPVKTHGRPAPSCLALYFFSFLMWKRRTAVTRRSRCDDSAKVCASRNRNFKQKPPGPLQCRTIFQPAIGTTRPGPVACRLTGRQAA